MHKCVQRFTSFTSICIKTFASKNYNLSVLLTLTKCMLLQMSLNLDFHLVYFSLFLVSSALKVNLRSVLCHLCPVCSLACIFGDPHTSISVSHLLHYIRTKSRKFCFHICLCFNSTGKHSANLSQTRQVLFVEWNMLAKKPQT